MIIMMPKDISSPSVLVVVAKHRTDRFLWVICCIIPGDIKNLSLLQKMLPVVCENSKERKARVALPRFSASDVVTVVRS